MRRPWAQHQGPPTLFPRCDGKRSSITSSRVPGGGRRDSRGIASVEGTYRSPTDWRPCTLGNLPSYGRCGHSWIAPPSPGNRPIKGAEAPARPGAREGAPLLIVRLARSVDPDRLHRCRRLPLRHLASLSLTSQKPSYHPPSAYDSISSLRRSKSASRSPCSATSPV